MRSWASACAGLWLGWLCLGAPAAPPPAVGETGDMPLRDLELPVERHPDGSPKTVLKAGAANVPPVGDIVARTVRVEMYDGQGRLQTLLTAEDCRYSRETRVARSGGAVKLESRGLSILGTGFEWHGDEERVTIMGDVRVTLTRNLLRTHGRLPGLSGARGGG